MLLLQESCRRKVGHIAVSLILFFLSTYFLVGCDFGLDTSTKLTGPERLSTPEIQNELQGAATTTVLEPSPTENLPIPDLVITSRVDVDDEENDVSNSSQSEQFPVWGVELHNMAPGRGLELIDDAGAKWVRRNALLWSLIEPSKGKRNWDAVGGLEKELISASEAGMEIILIVRRTPYWAQAVPGKLCGPVLDSEIEAFADFMADAVARYSVPPYNVMYWEIGNEPDIDPSLVKSDSVYGCWGDKSADYYGGEYYAKVLQAVYPRIKAENPEVQLLVGGLLLDCDPINPPKAFRGSDKYKNCASATYLEGILKGGGGDYFDGVSFHAYDYYYGKLGKYGNLNWHSEWKTTGPVLTEKVKYLQYLLFTYGYPDKYLINSEVGLVCGSTGSEGVCLRDEFELTKAYYAAQAYAAALAEGLRANVWYSITGWRGSGLVSPGHKLKPVYTTYQFSANELGNAQYVGELDAQEKVKGFEFNRDGTLIWLLWSLDGSEHQLHLPESPSAVYTVFGEPLPNGQVLTITLEPVYVEFSP
jgi:hypothetical protein